jgi:hypothetical protein
MNGHRQSRWSGSANIERRPTYSMTAQILSVCQLAHFLPFTNQYNRTLIYRPGQAAKAQTCLLIDGKSGNEIKIALQA